MSRFEVGTAPKVDERSGHPIVDTVSQKPLLAFENVSYTYTGATDAAAAVLDISFSVHAGEFIALVGNNGAGKTTVTKLMNGLLKPSAGTVYYDGVPTTELKTSAIARQVGMLFQNPDRQICQNTVFEEIAFGLRFTDLDREAQLERTQAVVDEFGFDGEKAPFFLSRGERQLVALASILVVEPRVLVLDEPTCGLDYQECMLVMEKVARLNAAGITVIMVSHDMEVVADFSQRIIVMGHGRLIADGDRDAMFRDQAIFGVASLLPPQIVELSMRFEGDGSYPNNNDDASGCRSTLTGTVDGGRSTLTDIARASTVDEMTQAVLAASKISSAEGIDTTGKGRD